jgi:hypothetical protein
MIKSNAVVASCDLSYFKLYGHPYVKSARKHGMTVCVNIDFDETNKENLEYIEDLKKMYPGSYFYFSDMLPQLPSVEKKFVYAYGRFVFGQFLLEDNIFDAILLTDIDCVFNRPVDWDDFKDVEYSLYRRAPLPGTIDWEAEGTKIAAGACYFGPGSKHFLFRMIELFNKVDYATRTRWFFDQYALELVRQEVEYAGTMRFRQMPDKYIDWNFNPESCIWTAKGPIKQSEAYKKIMKDIMDE